MIGIKSIRIQTSRGEQIIPVNPSPAKIPAPTPNSDTSADRINEKGGNNESTAEQPETRQG